MKQKETNIHEILESRKQIAVIWSIEDVREIRPDLNENQAWKVLKKCKESHDANEGITWITLEATATILYSEEMEKDTSMIAHSVETTTIPYVIQDDDKETRHELKNVDPAEAANLERCVLVIESYYVGCGHALIETAIEVYKRYGSVVLPDERILKDIAWGSDE